MDHQSLKEKTAAQQEERRQGYPVAMAGNEIQIADLRFTLVENYKEAFDPEQLAVRYTPLLARYDYVVGDLSAGQLRLRGFYDNERAVTANQKIQSLADYLYETVNFGAPYFVLVNQAAKFSAAPVQDFLKTWEKEHPKKKGPKREQPIRNGRGKKTAGQAAPAGRPAQRGAAPAGPKGKKTKPTRRKKGRPQSGNPGQTGAAKAKGPSGKGQQRPRFSIRQRSDQSTSEHI